MINTYVALDLETTGLNPTSDSILEIGAIKVVDDEIVDTFQTFVRYDRRISRMIKELTGINDEMVADGLAVDEAIGQFMLFCKDNVLLGHNIQFDYSFLKTQAVKAKKSFGYKGIDTLKIARKVLPFLEKRSLEYLCTYYNIAVDKSHRALDDALSAMKLYRIFQAKYQDLEEIFAPVDLNYKVKKDMPITPAQKRYLNDLIKYHTIELEVDIDNMSKSEASRTIDRIISERGKIRNNYRSANTCLFP